MTLFPNVFSYQFLKVWGELLKILFYLYNSLFQEGQKNTLLKAISLDTLPLKKPQT